MKKMVSILCGCTLAAVATASAEVVTCVNTGYTTGPIAGSGWSDGLTPSEDKDYLVNGGKVLSTGMNNTKNFRFRGRSLTIGDETSYGTIIFCSAGTTEFPCGIKIYNASNGSNVNSGNSQNQLTEVHHIDGPVMFDSSYKTAPQLVSAFRSNGQHLYFDGVITGDDKTGMKFSAGEWSNVNTNDLIAFTGDMSGYNGYIELSGSGIGTHKVLVLAFGNLTYSGTVKLTDGYQAFLRTVDTDDVAEIANLEMPEGATIFPQIDVANKKCGTIVVAGKFTRSGKQCIRAKFLNYFSSCDHGKISFPVLKVATSAGALNVDDFELAVEDAGEMPDGAVSLRVGKDESGVPTLYLDIAAYSSDGVTDVQMIKSDANQESAFLEEFSSHWNPIGVPREGRTYHISGGNELRTPYMPAAGGSNTAPFGDPVSFYGDAIVLGDAVSSGKMSHWSWAEVSVPRLVISNGVYALPSNWSGIRGGMLDSAIEICATDPSKAVFKTESTWQHLYLDGSLSGDADAAMRFLFTNANSDMHLYSDCSGYNGTIEVSATAGHGNNVADFRIGSKRIAGTLKLGTTTDVNGGKIKFAATNGLEVSRLIVNRPTSMSVGVNAITFATDYEPITVTENFELNSSMTLDVTVSGGDPITITENLDEAFIPIFKFPASCNVDESKFTLGNFTVSGNSSPKTPNAGYFTVLCRTEGDWRIMGLYKRKMCYLAYPDDSKTNSAPDIFTARTSFDECYQQEANRAYGWNWNDGVRPHPDCDYYVYNTLRTHSGMTDVYFQGHSMLLCNGTIVMQSYTATVTNLIINTGNLFHIHEGGDRKLNDFAPGGTRTVFGNAYVAKGGATITAPFIKTVGCFDVSLNISGIGDIKLLMNANNTFPLDVSFPCYLKLSKDNSSWTGKLMCAAANSAQWDEDECLTVLFSDKNNLGGELGSFTYNGITLRQSSILKPLNSVAYSRANRGIFIEGIGGMYPTNGITFAVNAPVTYYGKLRKLGGGALMFGGSAKFLQADGKTVGDDPIVGEELNVLRVEEGSVGVTAPLACDGVKAVFEEGTALRVKVTGTEDELQEKGLVNVKTATPFVLNASDGKLHVEFDTAGLASDGSVYRTAICTVKSDAASSLRGKLHLKRPSLKGYSAVLMDEVVDEQARTVTFTAELRYCAMRVIIR